MIKSDKIVPEKLAIAIVPGMKDILPREQEVFTYIKKVIRHRCRQSGFRRISTPAFEYAELFDKGFKKDPFLTKNLYRFTNAAGQKLALKADGTIPVVRAYFGNKLYEWPQPVHLYYLEPIFFDTPKSSRLTDLTGYQFGSEIIGEANPALAAQLINLAHKIMQDLGISQLKKVKINQLGCSVCQEKYLTDLTNFYFGKERSLCLNCREDLSSYPLRLLNCQEEDCQILAELAPKLGKYRCSDCVKELADLQAYLQELDIPFQVDEKLSRQINYYTGLIFEFLEIETKKPVIIGGGGRYDPLLQILGGQAVEGVGLSLSIEKIIQLMKKEKIKVPSKDNLQVFVAQLGTEAKKKCLVLMNELREAGIKTVGTLGKGSMREQLSLAAQFKVPYMTLMGLTEVREGNVIIRDMKIGAQKTLPFDGAVKHLTNLIGEANLDKYSPGEVMY